MYTIALYHLKGGVGKTSTSVNLSVLSAAENYRTLLWDLDPQGAASFYLESEGQRKNAFKKVIAGDLALSKAIVPSPFENLHVLPADVSAGTADIALSEQRGPQGQLFSKLKSIRNDFDVVILDCPPGLSLLHDNIFKAADLIVIPTIPTPLSMRSYEAIVEYFDTKKWDKTKLHAFFNMVDARKTIQNDTMKEYAKNRHFLKTFIPVSNDIEKMGVNLSPVAEFAPNGTAAIAYYHLWSELKKYIK